MKAHDVVRFAVQATARHRLRTALLVLAMAIGVGSVILLTALGEGARRYVVREFEALGSQLLVVLPGRSETRGGAPPLLGETPRDLTLDDALALERSALVRRVAPIAVGAAPASRGALEREATVLGTTAAFLGVRRLGLARGRFLPVMDPRRALPVCVLGARLRDELFGPEKALGQWVRLGDRRFRVVGVLEARGQSLGTDLGEVAIVPVASAQALFDTASLFRVLVEARSREDLPAAERHVLATLRERHEGEEDVTVITQEAVVGTFDRILGTLTLAVGGIAGISLAVAGILIMNVTLVAVSQRTAEIGLLKALGATSATVRNLFLAEAAVLAGVGALAGLAAGAAGIAAGRTLYPAFPLAAPAWAVVASLVVAVGTGLAFAVVPARRAARLDPVRALEGR